MYITYVCACLRVFVKYYTYGVGYGVAVCNEGQYQSLCKWNSKIAVPLFLYVVSILFYT